MGSITIDYGPFGFIDEYNPNFIPNHSDDMGRYDLESQANIGLWNLQKLAETLKPLLSVDKHQQLVTILQGYGKHYQEVLILLFIKKLGFKEVKDGDDLLIALLLDTMETIKADYTQTFRDLSELSLEDLMALKIPDSAWGLTACLKSKRLKEFMELYGKRIQEIGLDDETRMQRMQEVNPRYILRNWVAQEAIQRVEQNDFSEVQFLYKLLRNPYRINHEAEQRGYASPPPEWSKKLAVSCSS